MTHGQGDTCDDSNYEFVTIILCDADITGDGNAVIETVVFDTYDTNQVTADDPCVVTMTFKHETGCPIVDLYRVKLIFIDNEWLVGLIFILTGLFFGLFGLRFLNLVASIFGFFTVFFVTLYLASIFGYLETSLGIILSFSTALVISIIVSILAFFVIWIAIGFLGALGGYFAGLLIYETAIMPTDFSHAWAFMSITLTTFILGIVISIKYGREVTLFTTSLVGSYVCM